ncbi:MAG: AAA family ATPase [Candidatus Aminicenantes bacterium]|nr:MAG: AAA family ATPase [Candidatus Aminicenantes bacterium]
MMKIEKIYFKGLGPVSDALSPINLRNTWGKKIYTLVLFSGPNGCGKTILLNSIAFLWEAVSFWLDHRTLLPEENHIRKCFDRWGSFAVIIDELPDFSGKMEKEKVKICLFYGKNQWLGDIQKENNDVDFWLGEIKIGKKERFLLGLPKYVKDAKDTTALRAKVASPGPGYEEKNRERNEFFFNNWENAYKKLVLGIQTADTPNMIYLDAEERKWVKPGVNTGQLIPDDLTKTWLFRYTASEDWKDQLENTLVNFKIIAGEKEFKEVIKTLNKFLRDKEIVTTYRLEDRNRLRVRLKKGRGKYHYFDELSSGERHVLVVLFNVLRWMKPGGIVMIDNPDLFLHPSLVRQLVGNVEHIVEKKDGQLIITSHNTDLWRRCDNLGIKIRIGDPL